MLSPLSITPVRLDIIGADRAALDENNAIVIIRIITDLLTKTNALQAGVTTIMLQFEVATQQISSDKAQNAPPSPYNSIITHILCQH
jgi:hypothetical protein